jgi:hypothetical protein
MTREAPNISPEQREKRDFSAWEHHKTIIKELDATARRYANIRSPVKRFGKMAGHAPAYETEGPDIMYKTNSLHKKDLATRIADGELGGNVQAVTFNSKAPRVWSPSKTTREYKEQVGSLDYDKDENNGGRKHGIHETLQRRVDETGRKYYNMRSPVGRFSTKTKSQLAWADQLAGLQYDVDVGKYQTTTKMVERSARSYPGTRADRKGYKIGFSGKSAHFT